MRIFALLIILLLLASCKEPSRSGEAQVSADTTSTDNSIRQDQEKPVKKTQTPQPVKVICYTELQQFLGYNENDYGDRMISHVFRHLNQQFDNMLPTELRLLRNEFFARKGYIFKSEDLSSYFSKKDWYQPRFHTHDSIQLSDLDKQIIDTIKSYETKNASLTDTRLKSRLIKLFNEDKEYVSYKNGWFVTIPSTLFRRFLGYRIPGINFDAEHNEFFRDWYADGYVNVEIMDTLGQDVLVMSSYAQVMCPAEYCQYDGIVFTCDKDLNLIDSDWSGTFEVSEETKSDGKLSISFKDDVDGHSEKILTISPDGQIE